MLCVVLTGLDIESGSIYSPLADASTLTFQLPPFLHSSLNPLSLITLLIQACSCSNHGAQELPRQTQGGRQRSPRASPLNDAQLEAEVFAVAVSKYEQGHRRLEQIGDKVAALAAMGFIRSRYPTLTVFHAAVSSALV